ncbi:phage/plasmid primase, P4 family [uncultured Gemmobacter sp.]|uniref:DNA primase family protein n=1 Tax=uncultured Gemmobacter sp. TaxID=1095917 RepID=UPI000A75AB04|nr:phage/plasmid primase, P4 family [uncultured Gemmobacter sp.]
MTDNLDAVRQIMASAEDVDMPEGLVAPEADPDPDAPLGDEDVGYPGDDAMPPHPPIEEGEPPPLEAECVMFPLNDFGNAQRFIRHFGQDVRFVQDLGWVAWNGTHFQLDPQGLVVRALSQQLGELIAKEIPYITLDDWQMEAIGKESDLRARVTELQAATDEDGRLTPDAEREIAEIGTRLRSIADLKKTLSDKRKAHRNFTRTAGNSGRIKAALEEAAPHVKLRHEDLDSDPLAINCLSGTLRMALDIDPDTGTRTASVRLDPHDRADNISKRIEAGYDPAARCPKFLAFLERVQPAEEMRRYLQRWLGLSISGLPVQAMMFWYGAGANGKSVLSEMMAKLLGDYAADIRIETLTGKGQQSGAQATPDLVYLVGARFARAMEPREGEQLQAALVKSITSGEPIMVRANYGAFFRLYPYFKLTMSGNHKPDIRETDDGIWRRMKLVPWDVQIPEAERDPDLIAKLMEERDGILQWLIDGLIDYLEGGMQEPDQVRQATQEYREDSDPIGSFIAGCCHCTGNDKDRVGARDLGMAFNYWLQLRGETRWSDRRVAMRLKEKVGRWRSPRDGQGYDVVKAHGVMTYTGIRFDEEFGPRFWDAPRDQDGRPIPGRTPFYG